MSSRRRIITVLFIFVLLVMIGCSDKPKSREGGPDGEVESSSTELMLFCGAGIRPPIAEIIELFQDKYGVNVVTDYGGSGTLLAKIKLTQKGDLYMPGDIYYVDLIEDLVVLKKPVCYWTPVILVQKGNPKDIRTLKDLLRDDVKFGAGDAKACAIGKKTMKIFEKNGFATEDIMAALSFQSQTVNELGMQIQADSLDAVIVWDSIARYYSDHGDVVEIPLEQNIISTIPVSVLKATENRELAEKFVDFLFSDEVREIFKKYNYGTEPPE